MFYNRNNNINKQIWLFRTKFKIKFFYVEA